jgi:hypothetical protein
VTPPAGRVGPQRPAVDAARLWAGGAATAVVAALVAVVGVLILKGVLDIPMVVPPLLPIGGSFVVRYALTAAVLALVATGLAHLLALTTPRPRSFFSWIIGLATVAGCALPFALEGSIGGQLATAVVNLVIGLCVGSLLITMIARTTVPPLRRGPAPGAPMY